MKGQRQGLQTTVKLHGVVVEQGVTWCPGRVTDWIDAAPSVPTSNSHPRVRWASDGVPEMDHVECLSKGTWHWNNSAGVEVEFVQIGLQRAPRGSGGAVGDVGLLVMMLAMMVGLGQLNFLFRAWVGERPSHTRAVQPSPELIARLLREEFGGAESGRVAHVQRRESVKVSPSFYLPAGASGPVEHIGGGRRAGEDRIRGITEQDAAWSGSDPSPKEKVFEAEIDPLVQDAPQTPGIRGLVEPAHPEQREKQSPPASVEKFVGWGFHDWLDVAEADDGAEREMVERLELARELMKIDPDQPYAILTVAYYAYLSENYSLCRSLYGRYIELYPDDAAGWNNLALTFKRSGEYLEEERLYRRSLVLEPGNSNTRNNLAVNLAHQGRFREAEALMDTLQPEPEEEPYAELHRAKIAAEQGQNRKAQRHLKRAVKLAHRMDTFHHIEFRQDIRLDPSFKELRSRRSMRRILDDAYGDDSPLRLGKGPARAVGQGHG